MKKLLALGLVVLFSFLLVACGDNTDKNSDGNLSTNTAGNAQATADWREFLSDYEALADEYVELMQNANTDEALRADCEAKASELAQWLTKTDEIKASITSDAELAEFEEAIRTITTKIANAEQ